MCCHGNALQQQLPVLQQSLRCRVLPLWIGLQSCIALMHMH